MRQGAFGQLFRIRDIGRRCLGHDVKDPGGERDCQPTLRNDGLSIECQGPLEEVNRLRAVLPRGGLQPRGAPPQDELLGILPLHGFGRSGLDQLEIEGVSYPAGDLVLQRKQIAGVASEPLRPEMRIGFGVD
jgi:hypothetical protein